MTRAASPVIQVEHVDVTFRGNDGHDTRALVDVTVDVARGDVLAVVGESGSGKSTLARALLGLLARQRGIVRVFGTDVPADPARMPRDLRRRIQPVFQDPSGALDPRFLARDTLFEPMSLRTPRPKRAACEAEARELMQQVELDPALLDRFPHEMSGGQKQRLCIARAVAVRPEILVLDEPLSALDVSLQVQILELLERLKRERDLTYVMITHDLSLLRRMATGVLVLYRGYAVEAGVAADVIRRPLHPYTRALVASTPESDPARARAMLDALPAEVPSTELPATGCIYRLRCPLVEPSCATTRPPMQAIQGGRQVACPVAVRTTA